MTPRFRSFRGRLVVVFVGLSAIVLATSFVAAALFARASARQEIEDELRLASVLFARQLESRGQQLLAATQLLSGDFALKTTAATADHQTTGSVLENHRRRIGADVLMLVSLDGAVLVDTLHPERTGTPFPAPALLEQAESAGEASQVAVTAGGLFRLAVVPLRAPIPIAWLCAGFAIDDRVAEELRQLTGLHVSFVRRDGDGLTVLGSTLEAAHRVALRRALPVAGESGLVELGGHAHVLRASQVSPDVLVVLQRPLAEALRAYDRLLGILSGVAVAGVLLSLAGAVLVARRVSRPVLALAAAAGRVAGGDFTARVTLPQRDELGALGTTFNEMAAGLQERDRVRDELERTVRLKRFFSPQLASVLSADDDRVLASHRREITVVFCDLRGFTSFAETAEPEEVMRVLGEYHATLGRLVFAFEGTLERFTGDGLMVFFNDPLPCPDPAARAVRMALAMRDAVEPFLAEWRRRGHGLGFGMGIAMGHATIGRIGFEGRIDYAAIGTVTNLSARLCQEAKDGQILVSGRVYTEVEGLVEATALGALPLRGFAKPVEVFDVRRLLDEPDATTTPPRPAAPKEDP